MTPGWSSFSPISISRMESVEEYGVGFHIGMGTLIATGPSVRMSVAR